MALRTYNETTLNDNWFEERAEPLDGVLANHGNKEYNTTFKSEFRDNNTSRNLSRAEKLKLQSENRKNNGRGLVVKQAMIAPKETAIERVTGFRSVLPTPDRTIQERHLATTNETAFGKGVKDSLSKQRKIKDGNVPPSGGAGGERVSKGLAASGAMGEVYKTLSDPQKNTKAQRSWLYSVDPMITAKEGRVSCSTNQSPTGTELRDQSQVSFRRKSSVITANPMCKDGIFADD